MPAPPKHSPATHTSHSILLYSLTTLSVLIPSCSYLLLPSSSWWRVHLSSPLHLSAILPDTSLPTRPTLTCHFTRHSPPTIPAQPFYQTLTSHSLSPYLQFYPRLSFYSPYTAILPGTSLTLSLPLSAIFTVTHLPLSPALGPVGAVKDSSTWRGVFHHLTWNWRSTSWNIIRILKFLKWSYLKGVSHEK